jgi:large subunit ribosomal protein L24
VVEEITYEPKLCTFDMDIMEKMNIKEDRTPTKTYWY